MKKLILAVLVAVVGFAPSQVLADPNQGGQMLEQAGAGILGAAIGYNGAKAAGANQPWAIAGGILGADLGVSMVRTYQQPPQRPIYRGQPQPRYSYGPGAFGNSAAYERGAEERARREFAAAEQCDYNRGLGNYNHPSCYNGGYNVGGW